jgi:hypothetical protein
MYILPMDAMRTDGASWELDLHDLRKAMRLLTAMEKAAWVSAEEAAEWRSYLAEWGIFHEDPLLWIDGPQA